LTFPAIVIGLLIHFGIAGWKGLVLGLAGALIAPALLFVLHLGRGIGMGDVKLVAGLGAILGPFTGLLAVLVSAVVGGAMAGLIILCAPHASWPSFWRRRTSPAANQPQADVLVGALTMPYGVAIGIGTLITLAVTWLEGGTFWLL
jgi:prepilin peptidase CpaA